MVIGTDFLVKLCQHGFLCGTTQKGGTIISQLFLPHNISKKQGERETVMVKGKEMETTLTVVVPNSYSPSGGRAKEALYLSIGPNTVVL